MNKIKLFSVDLKLLLFDKKTTLLLEKTKEMVRILNQILTILFC